MTCPRLSTLLGTAITALSSVTAWPVKGRHEAAHYIVHGRDRCMAYFGMCKWQSGWARLAMVFQ